CLQSKNSPFSF
nr:immunoglobulin light chain junction region [Macaca mulatta]MOX97932.1 immunoglobulin light chain junction region [Macaca mulatta]MOY00358.1 immunoglobulin light chain junction region [Macaca mulatta]MOY00985.1 immunoglobulin light chain junction region [Macaca mulatta]MOY01453.1 immunoglobulin light chain junction region [Macaca mulatta]